MKYLKNYPSFLLRKFKTKKISFSQTGLDLLLSNIFKGLQKGFYIDIGCNHPVYNNNTFLFYKRGWRGLNIDLDKSSIDLFNIYRKGDLNIHAALSSSNNTQKVYEFHKKSPLNTLVKKVANYQKAEVKNIYEINTITLNEIINDKGLQNNKINFLTIDVEGHEVEVLKGLNIDIYRPDVIVVEYLDLNLEKLEIKNLNINNVLNSEIYQYMVSKNYSLINWLHSDLIFVNNEFKIK